MMLCYAIIPHVSNSRSALMAAVGDTQVTTAYSRLHSPAADRKAVLILIMKTRFQYALLLIFLKCCLCNLFLLINSKTVLSIYVRTTFPHRGRESFKIAVFARQTQTNPNIFSLLLHNAKSSESPQLGS